MCIFNQISPPYKYFRIKRAVYYLWLEILDESLLYFLEYHQVRDKINCVVIYSFAFPVLIAIAVNAVFQIFFCNIQIFCNFIFIFTTVFVSSDQTEQSDAAVVSPEPCLTLLFSIAGIFHVDNITDGSVVVTELLCQNTGFSAVVSILSLIATVPSQYNPFILLFSKG